MLQRVSMPLVVLIVVLAIAIAGFIGARSLQKPAAIKSTAPPGFIDPRTGAPRGMIDPATGLPTRGPYATQSPSTR